MYKTVKGGIQMRIYELTDFESSIQNRIEKQLLKDYRKKHLGISHRYRVLITKTDKVVLKNIICEGVSFRLMNFKFLKEIEVGSNHIYYFLLDDYNRILPYNVNHFFCPDKIEK